MAKKIFAENSFEGGVSGGNGTSNYQTSLGTPSGGDYSQNPDHFASSDVPSTGSKLPDPLDRVSSTGYKKTTAVISPAAQADQQKSEKPLNPEHAFDGKVDKLFTKKNTPSPDEIMTGLKYELSQMVHKDKSIAKQTVLVNLKLDPQYYSRLGMLNIDDDKMKVDESNNFSKFLKTKDLLEKMVTEKKDYLKKDKVPNTDEIFKEMWKNRHHY